MTTAPPLHPEKLPLEFKDKTVAVYTGDLSVQAISFISNSSFPLFGFHPEAFYDKGFALLFSCMHPEDYSVWLKQYASLVERAGAAQLNSGIPVTHHFFRFQTKVSPAFWVENVGVVLDFTDSGAPKTCIGFFKKAGNGQTPPPHSHLPSLAALFEQENTMQGLAWLAQSKGNLKLLELALDGEVETKISDREKQVLSGIASGLSAKEIASQLFISVATVTTHRNHLLEKFHARNTAELVKKASKMYWFE